MQVTGCRLKVTGYRLQVAGCRLQFSYLLLVTCYLSPATLCWAAYLLMRRMTVERITPALINTRSSGTHICSRYSGVSCTAEIPVRLNKKTAAMNATMIKHTVPESYQGMIIFLYIGFGSSRIMTECIFMFGKNQDAGRL